MADDFGVDSLADDSQFSATSAEKKLLQIHAFGGRGGVVDSVGYVNEVTVAHLVGKHAVLYNTETKRCSFLAVGKNTKEILAMCVSPNWKAIALCERVRDDNKATVFGGSGGTGAGTISGAGAGAGAGAGISGAGAGAGVSGAGASAGAGAGTGAGAGASGSAPATASGGDEPGGATGGSEDSQEHKAQVSVYHVASRRRIRTMAVPMKGEFRLCAFSGDNKLLATLGGQGADAVLVVWRWNAEKVVAMARCNPDISRIRFVPRDSSLISASGPNYLRVWKSTGDNLRELPLLHPKVEAESDFVDHAWMGSRPTAPGEAVQERRLLATTSTGTIYVFVKEGEGILGTAPPVTLASLGLAPSGTGAQSGASGPTAGFAGAEAGKSGAESTSTFELRTVVRCSLGERKEDDVPTCLKTVVEYSKGFAVAGNNGFFAVYEKTDDKKEPFVHLKTLQHGNDTIETMSVSSNDETLVAYSASSMFRTFPLALIDTISDKRDHFTPLVTNGVHTHGIVDFDTNLQQTTVATVCSQKVLRVWNYLNWSCEVAATLEEDPVCISLHPTGMFVAVGSKEKLAIYNVLIRSLALQQTFSAKAVRSLAYSHGGSMLAAAVGFLVVVFNAYTGAQIASFPGHAGVIRQLLWSSDDTTLCSAGEDGHVYAFSVASQPPMRVEDLSHVVKSCRYTTLALTHDKRSLVSAGRDASGMCVLQVACNGEITTFDTKGVQVTRLAVDSSGSYLYCGTAAGTIRIYQWPLRAASAPDQPTDDGNEEGANTSMFFALPEPEFVEIALHRGAVTALSLSYDGRYLFTTATDGTVFVCGIPYPTTRQKRGGSLGTTALSSAGPGGGGGAPQHSDQVGTSPSSRAATSITWEAANPKHFNGDVTLVDRDEMEEALSKLEAMEKKLDEVKNDSEYKLHLKENEWSEKAAAVAKEMEEAIENERQRCEQIQARHERYVREQVEQREKTQQDHSRMAQDLENQYEMKLAMEMERYDRLSEQVERLQQGCEELLRESQDKHREQVETLTTEIRDKDREYHEMKTRLEEEARLQEAAHAEALRQVEAEYEEEITHIKLRFQGEIADQERKTEHKQGALTSQGNKLESAKKRLKEAKQKCSAKERECDKLNHRILQLEEQLRVMGRTTEALETSLLDKEKDIANLRAENRTLENFRFVLDHRISKMNAERGPITAHVGELERHVEHMYSEMVKEFEDKKAAARAMSNKDLKIEGFTQELAALRASVRDKDRKIAAFQAAAEALIHTDSKHLDQAVMDLYQQCVKPEKSARRVAASSTAKALLAKATDAVAGAGPGSLPPGALDSVASVPDGRAAGAKAPPGSPGDQADAGPRKAVRAGALSDDVSLKDHQDTVHEVLRQRQHLEHSAATLRRQLQQTSKSLTRKVKMATDDNVVLIGELNRMRKESVEKDRIIKRLETELAHSRGEKSLVGSASFSSLPSATAPMSSTHPRPDTLGSRASERLPAPTSPIHGGSSTRGTLLSGGNQADAPLAADRPLSRPARTSRGSAGSKSTGALPKPFSSSSGQASEPALRSTIRGRISRGPTSRNSSSGADRKVGALLSQIDENEREMAMQRAEIQRLRTMLQTTASSTISGPAVSLPAVPKPGSSGGDRDRESARPTEIPAPATAS